MQQTVTFIAVANGTEIHVNILIAEKHETQPGIKHVDWHNK